ncbi:hypothetical protein N7G274_010205 [Stereocaulon virgatum]|uniref:Uncharacterized protein n=1 Tax=Stereocaulon virgatum TaxID=373712 RepID=A0ABR3ZUX6_9LECA
MDNNESSNLFDDDSVSYYQAQSTGHETITSSGIANEGFLLPSHNNTLNNNDLVFNTNQNNSRTPGNLQTRQIDSNAQDVARGIRGRKPSKIPFPDVSRDTGILEAPRGKRLQLKETRREKLAAKKNKNAAARQVILGDTPVPESIEAQFKVESIEQDEMPIPVPRFSPAFVNPQDFDLYRDTNSIARELYATPTPAFDFPGLEPKPFASFYPDFY